MRTMRRNGWVVVLTVWTCLASSAALSAVEGFWSADRRLTFDPGQSRTSFNFTRGLASGPRGRLHAVWEDHRDGRWQVYYKRSDRRGERWSADRRLSAHPAESRQPAVAVFGRTVYVVWHDLRLGVPVVFFTRSTDAGLHWDAAVPISGAQSAHASIAAVGQRVYATWASGASGFAEVYTRRSLDGGRSWEEAVQISDSPFESWVPSVTVEGKDVYVAWVDYRVARPGRHLVAGPEVDRGARRLEAPNDRPAR